MMEEKGKNAVDDLIYIKKIIADSKNIIIDNGIGFIVWGILIIIGLSVNYLRIKYQIGIDAGITWIVVVGLGWIYTISDVIKEKKKRKVSTFAGKIMGALWVATGIAATILGFVGPNVGAYNGVFISSLISTVIGVSYFVSGVLYGYKWISGLGILWWGGAITIFIMQNLETLLVMIFMMFTLQVVPGIMLYRKSKEDLQSTA